VIAGRKPSSSLKEAGNPGRDVASERRTGRPLKTASGWAGEPAKGLRFSPLRYRKTSAPAEFFRNRPRLSRGPKFRDHRIESKMVKFPRAPPTFRNTTIRVLAGPGDNIVIRRIGKSPIRGQWAFVYWQGPAPHQARNRKENMWSAYMNSERTERAATCSLAVCAVGEGGETFDNLFAPLGPYLVYGDSPSGPAQTCPISIA